jgi:hypothetical protein
MPEPESRLEAVLMEVGRGIEFPPTPNLTVMVEQRLRSDPGPRTRPPRLARSAFAVAALLVVVGLFLTISGDARRAVADWLGISGIRIEVDENGPTPEVPRSPVDLRLGEKTNLKDARSIAGFDVLDGGRLGRPDEVWVQGSRDATRVSFIFNASRDLPASEVTGVGAVLTQFIGQAQPDSLKKVASTGTKVRFTAINGRPAYWIAGAPHELTVVGASGEAIPLGSRVAGNVLLWESGPLTMRLESALSFDEAVSIANSIP